MKKTKMEGVFMEENRNDMQNVEDSTVEMQTNDNNTQQNAFGQQTGYSNTQQNAFEQQTGYSNAQQSGYGQQNVVYDDQWVKPGDQGLAITGLILGVLSLICCCTGMGFPFAVGSLIVSIISLNQKKPGKGMAIAGIVCSVLGLLLSIIMIIVSVIGAFALENSVYSTAFDNYYSSYYDW